MKNEELYKITATGFSNTLLRNYYKLPEFSLNKLNKTTGNKEYYHKIIEEINYVKDMSYENIFFAIINLLYYFDKSSYKTADALSQSLIACLFEINESVLKPGFTKNALIDMYTINFNQLGLNFAEIILSRLVFPLKIYKPAYTVECFELVKIKTELNTLGINNNFADNPELYNIIKCINAIKNDFLFHSILSEFKPEYLNIMKNIVNNNYKKRLVPMNGIYFICDSLIEERYEIFDEATDSNNQIKSLKIDFSNLGELNKFVIGMGSI